MRRDRTAVGEFTVLADCLPLVEMACGMALNIENQASYYGVNVEENGSHSLTFYWTEVPGATKLPFPIRDAKELALFICRWMDESAKYGPDPYAGGDGDSREGVLLTNQHNTRHTFYTVISAIPEWTHYGK